MSGPMIMALFLVLAGVTLLFEFLSRPKGASAPERFQECIELEREVDRLEARLRTLEKIVTDPEERLEREINRLK